MVTNEQAIAQTQQWIKEVVIGLNFCPFAAREVNKGSVHYVVAEGTKLHQALDVIQDEIERLDANPEIETTLVIFPAAFTSFSSYLDLVEMAEAMMERNEYDGVYQVASFHPQYRFAEVQRDDPANYTNRSPYPMVHLLREASLSKALQHYPDLENIPERNIALARAKGFEAMKALRAACMQ
jgi:hypothetical protein